MQFASLGLAVYTIIVIQIHIMGGEHSTSTNNNNNTKNKPSNTKHTQSLPNIGLSAIHGDEQVQQGRDSNDRVIARGYSLEGSNFVYKIYGREDGVEENINKSGGLFGQLYQTAFGWYPSLNQGKLVLQHNKLTPAAQLTIKQIMQQCEATQNYQPQRDQRIKYPKTKIFKYFNNGATYQGQFIHHDPHGYGVIHYKDGSFFQGNFQYGVASGHGLYVYADGSMYEGGFRDSYYWGYGVLNYRVKRMKYVGEFVGGKPHGRGEEIYEDGQCYKGQFVNGLKEGKGTYIWKSGHTYIGDFKVGIMHGHGKLLKNDTLIYQGTFKYGLKQGQGILNSPKKISYHGKFTKDLLQGPGSVIKITQGVIYEGIFKKSRLWGPGYVYYFDVRNGEVNDESNVDMEEVVWEDNIIVAKKSGTDGPYISGGGRKLTRQQIINKIKNIKRQHKLQS